MAQPGRPVFIVVSGIPGSGKTTLARALAEALDLPLLDKDDFLEGLFESEGTGDPAWRHGLSRRADHDLREAAAASSGAVLATFWRHPTSTGDSGTPTDWLDTLPGTLIEVHCACDTAVAARRFLDRHRHPGHLDERRNADDLRRQLEDLSRLGPLGLGRLFVTRTDGGVAIEPLTRAIEDHIGQAERTTR